MLILVLALILTLIESARVSALRARLQSITYMASDACFSKYAREIFDEYGVMMLRKDDSGYIKDLDGFIDANLDTSGLMTGPSDDIFKAAHKSSTLISKTTPLSRDGLEFSDQVLEYMNFFLVEDAAQRILEHTSIFDESDKVNDFMEKIESYGDVFKKVEEQAGKIKDKVDKVKQKAAEPLSLISSLSENAEAFKSGDPEAAKRFSDTLRELKKTDSSLRSSLEDISSATDKYYSYVEDAREAVGELEENLDIEKEGFSDDVYAAVSNQVEDIKQKCADTDFDYYLVGANGDTARKYIDKLESLDALFDEISEPVNEENVEAYAELIDKYKDDFSDFSLEGLNINLVSEKNEKEDDGFIDAVNRLFENGILGFVAGEISEKSIETDELPSHEESGEKAGDFSVIDKAVLGEYILTHFGNAGENGGDKALDYETEYIISGKDSDRDNLAAIVGDIVLIRTGCNLISLLKSSAKLAETEGLAMAVAGCTGMPIVIKIVQILIITAWALAESIADAKALLAGHKVPTVKDDADWYISIAGLKNFGEESLNVSACEKGLSYESYLRLILLSENSRDQRFRTMDMIQANMCNAHDSSFRIAGCLTSAETEVHYTSPSLFTSLSFVQALSGSQSSGYELVITQNYTY